MTKTGNDWKKNAAGLVLPKPGSFSKLLNDKQINLFTLVNDHGVRTDITNYGGRIVSLFLPDKNGIFDDVVAGYLSIDEYLQSNELYFGALVGRFANRIAGGRFAIDGKWYQLAKNNGPNHLHGGPGGLHNVVWNAKQIDKQSLQLSYLSPDKEEGFPGNLDISVLFTLTDKNELHISYRAITDRTTIVNLTGHAFFNLAGEHAGSIDNHILQLHADHYTPVNEQQIPTGRIEPVSDTPLDFRELTPIGQRIQDKHLQIHYCNGYDHNYVLNKTLGAGGPEVAATVYDPVSRRKMDVLTTEPGIQFYSGNFLNGRDKGKQGETYKQRSFFCLEPQHFPDSPNHPEFPSTLLHPGEVYASQTVYRFSTYQ